MTHIVNKENPLDAYKVITMCHCDEFNEDGEVDEECYDHWQVGIPKGQYDEISGHCGVASDVSGAFASREDAQAWADVKNGKR